MWTGVFTVLFLVFISSLQSFAQVLYGSLTGQVTDPSGLAVPNAKVQVLDTGTGVAQQTTTDGRGMYIFTHLQAGAYRITTSAPSLGTVIQNGIQLNTNTEQRVDVQLQLARRSETVTVSSQAAALETQRTDLTSLLSSTQLANLPLGQDRNFQSLFILIPGVTPPAAGHSYAANPTGGLAMQANGQAQTINGTMIDGTPNPNFWEENVIAYVPPANAILSVDVVTGGFDAEQGSANGVISNVVIKSGTNSFHGSAWEYNTDSSVQARNYFFVGAKTPKNILNQFGVNLGGPIIKNKLFFFGDWERYRLVQDINSTVSVPPMAIRNGDFSSVNTIIYNPTTGNPNGTGRMPFAGNKIDPSLLSSAALAFAALIPAPNEGSGGIANNYFSSGNFQLHRDSVDMKVNYNPSDSSTLFGRYSAEPTYIFDPQTLGPAGGDSVGPQSGQPGNGYGLTQSVTIAGTHTFTPHFLFDANVGFTRQALSAAAPDIGTNFGLDTLHIPGTNGPTQFQGGQPGMQISGLSDLGNVVEYSPFFFWDNEYLFAANLSWIRGSHSFRFGGIYTRVQLNHIQTNTMWAPRGGFSFSGSGTALNGGPAPNAYNSWAQFLLGLPSTFGKDNVFISPDSPRERSFSFYARDVWQATSKLSVNYGVRYEYYPFATHDHFGALNYDPSTNFMYVGGMGGVPRNAYVDAGKGLLVPRLGVAYSIDKKTVVRAGFGMSTNPEPFSDQMNFYPSVISQQFTAANSFGTTGSFVTGIPSFTGPSLSQGKIPLPTNVGTQTFPEHYRRGYVEGYNLVVQRNLGAGFDGQVGYVGNHTVREVVGLNLNAAGPGQGVAGGLIDQLYGNPNTITSLTPYSGGNYNALQAQVKRRVRGAEVAISYTYSKTIDYVDGEGSGLLFGWGPALERNRAAADYDIPHNFELWAVYDLPFGKGQTWVTQGPAAAILGGWELSSILSRLSGTPFNVTSSGASLNAPGNTQVADQVLPNVAILGGHGPNKPYFNPNAFAPVTAVRLGTSGRDSVRGPGVFILDMSIARVFTLGEGFTLKFRADAFSLTNTPNFSNPSANVSNATFTGGTVQSLNGYDTISAATGNRQVQFGLTLAF